jgi:hypothetical protein
MKIITNFENENPTEVTMIGQGKKMKQLEQYAMLN